MKKIYLLLLVVLCAVVHVRASHISGGDIAVQALGNNTYVITLNLFRDCDGISMSAAESMEATSPCGATVFFTATLINPGGTNISQLCPQDSLNGTCFGGTLPGMQLYTYVDTIVLNPPCNTWNIGWTTCCRNNTVNVPTSSSDDIWIQAEINTVTDPMNNTPIYTSQPIPYVCINQPVNYNYGVVELDGDSMTFALIAGYIAQGTSLTYGGGYSGTVPVSGITIDPITGNINFTPTTLGNFVVVVETNEYDANGNLLSTVMRDIQFVVLNCSNQVPDINAGQITNMTGNAVVTGPNSIDICEGNTFSFTAVYTDPDVNDSLFISTNMGTVLPNSSFTTSGSNPLTVNYFWTVPPGASGTNTTFVVTISDNACPVTGIQSFVYDINVLDRTLVGPDWLLCGSQTATPLATGGTTFTWYDLAGNQIVPGPTFSCNPCADPQISPLVTTTYVVQSNLTGACINTDTMTVVIVPDFSYTTTTSQLQACLLQPVQLDVVVNPPGNYTFQWTPAGVMSDPTISNPLATFSQPGLYTIEYTMTSPAGCVQVDSLVLSISSNVAPDVTAMADSVCIGQLNNLYVNFNNVIPAICGPSPSACNGPLTLGTIGAGTASNGATAYPNVFGNWSWGSRHQILYTQADLAAMGFTGGTISSIAFELVNLNFSTNTYQNFTIRMTCSGLAALFGFQGGLTSVFGPQNVTPTLGWNTFNLSTPYNYNGTGGLLIEVCFNNSTSSSNCSNTYTLTPFNSVVYYDADVPGVCNNAAFSNLSNERPNLRLGYCSATPGPNQFTYQWMPGSLLNDNTLSNPQTILPVDTTFMVIVTAVNGGCSDTSFVDIHNVPQPGPATIGLPPSTFFCISDPAYLFAAATPGGTWSGPGINPSSGLFTPALAGQGNHQIIYSLVNSLACFTSDTIYLDVAFSPDPTILYNGPDTICISTTPFFLTPQVAGGFWSGTAIDPQTGLFDPSAAGVGTFDLVYTLGSGNCIEDDTVRFTIIALPDSSISPVATLCENGLPIPLQAATPGGLWSGNGVINAVNGVFDPGTSGDGFHNVVYTFSNVCSFVTDMNIQVNPPPPTPIIINSSPVCEDEDISFITASVQNASYFWSGPDGFTAAVNTPVNPLVSLADSGVYSCYIMVNGCFSDTGYTTGIVLGRPPQPIIIHNAPLCEGSDLVLETDPYPGASYLWSGPNGFSANSMQVIIPNVQASASGLYEIVKQANGCVSPPKSETLIIHPKPEAAFLADPPFTDTYSPHVQFINTGSTGMQYAWWFGDGTTSVDFSPVHTFADSGMYPVLLVVTDPVSSCLDSTSITYQVDPYYGCYIPNAFTPNGDGNNDEWRIAGNAIAAYRLAVYDRWGAKMFESSSINEPWDGTHQGSAVMQGAYVYQIRIQTLKGEEKRYEGTVQLYR